MFAKNVITTELESLFSKLVLRINYNTD